TVMIGCMALMVGGRPIDMECGVCFGIIGVRIVTDAVEPAETVPQSNGSQERDVPRQLHAALGPPFSVFLPVVQADLKVSDDQKQKLQQLMMSAAQGFQQFTHQIEILSPAERDKKHQEFREAANKRIAEAMANLLEPEQQKRLRQIMLQQEGLFALGN